jgi:uncharacterized protein (TIGR03083 family)
MSDAIEAVAADRAALIEIGRGLDDAGWRAPSGCPGWSVQDVVSHVGAICWMVVDPSRLPDTGDLPAEQAQEAYVRARRAMTAEEVLADYVAVSEKALGILQGFVGVESEVPLGDLGTYPASYLPIALCFDLYTHIRADLFTPRGPLTGPPPAADELRLVPTLEWIEAALPQQNAKEAAELDDVGSVELTVTGTGARTLRVGPGGPVSATVRSGGDALVRWITQRASWDEVGGEASGDPQALDILRRCKVF